MLDLNTLKRIDPNTLNEQSFNSIIDEIVANNDVVAYCYAMDNLKNNKLSNMELNNNKPHVVEFLEVLHW